MTRISVRASGCLLLLLLSAGALHATTNEIATPQGIIVKETSYGSIFADGQGRQLYVFDCDEAKPNTLSKDRPADGVSYEEVCKRIRAKIANPGPSVCNGTCTAEWPPLIASEDAKAAGDWSTVQRDDGTRQWAYRGRPLYRYSRENLTYFVPMIGSSGNWHTAFTQWYFGQSQEKPPIAKPLELKAAPAGIAALEYPAFGPTLVDYRGMTLYMRAHERPQATSCAGECRKGQMLTAPVASQPIGQWTIANRDTTPQWAYKGRALFLCAADQKPGDTNCRGDYWQIAQP